VGPSTGRGSPRSRRQQTARNQREGAGGACVERTATH
jgi:hypothetical protein